MIRSLMTYRKLYISTLILFVYVILGIGSSINHQNKVSNGAYVIIGIFIITYVCILYYAYKKSSSK